MMKLSKFLHDLTTATAIFDLDYDCFSLGQLESKEWLIEILDDVRKAETLHLGNIFVLCGWYGILSAMLFLKFDMIPKIRSFDIDPECEKIADQINKTYSSDGWRFKAITEDINKINFDKHTWQCWSNKNNRMSYPIADVPSTIINTSCEHVFPTWYENVPEGKLVILQSNDSVIENGHICPVTCAEEFQQMYPTSKTYYCGKMKLEKYNRFMIIGVK